jgi:cation diffusion facilitator CzcD-associated flavoprotein CzcO
MDPDRTSEHVQVVVIGAGQAGLSVGYCLAAHRVSFVILESHARVGDSWRRRWDSMRLFNWNGQNGSENTTADSLGPGKRPAGERF